MGTEIANHGPASVPISCAEFRGTDVHCDVRELQSFSDRPRCELRLLAHDQIRLPSRDESQQIVNDVPRHATPRTAWKRVGVLIFWRHVEDVRKHRQHVFGREVPPDSCMIETTGTHRRGKRGRTRHNDLVTT